MFSKALLTTALVGSAAAVNVISCNDDGWAEKNIRVLYDTFTAAGHDVVVSAPAENQSGTGSLTSTPGVVTSGCEFDSCPAGSPAYGNNASEPQLNYVNSYPATAVTYGINTLAETYFGGAPDIAVLGPNVGSNTGVETFFSGTVGAAVAASNLNIPAIAFSGETGSQVAWTTATESYQQIYADLALKITNEIVASGTPYLPSGTWLNVNFPEAGDGTSCTSVDDFSFVLSRIYTAVILVSSADVETCDNNERLPTETTVVGTDGCYVALSLGKDSNKRDASADEQAVVLDKLSSILTCLP